ILHSLATRALEEYKGKLSASKVAAEKATLDSVDRATMVLYDHRVQRFAWPGFNSLEEESAGSQMLDSIVTKYLSSYGFDADPLPPLDEFDATGYVFEKNDNGPPQLYSFSQKTYTCDLSSADLTSWLIYCSETACEKFFPRSVLVDRLAAAANKQDQEVIIREHRDLLVNSKNFEFKTYQQPALQNKDPDIRAAQEWLHTHRTTVQKDMRAQCEQYKDALSSLLSRDHEDIETEAHVRALLAFDNAICDAVGLVAIPNAFGNRSKESSQAFRVIGPYTRKAQDQNQNKSQREGNIDSKDAAVGDRPSSQITRDPGQRQPISVAVKSLLHINRAQNLSTHTSPQSPHNSLRSQRTSPQQQRTSLRSPGRRSLLSPMIPSLEASLDVFKPTPAAPSTFDEKGLQLPFLFCEDKMYDKHNFDNAFNQARFYLVSAIYFYAALGIYDLAVFAIANNGHRGYLLSAWGSRPDGGQSILTTKANYEERADVIINIADSNCPEWDISQVTDAMLHAPKVAQEFENIREGFNKAWEATKSKGQATRLMWTAKQQLQHPDDPLKMAQKSLDTEKTAAGAYASELQGLEDQILAIEKA
ncbi:hypothetical protein EV121DRAFT_273048, partial [Schizophyllum commune]